LYNQTTVGQVTNNQITLEGSYQGPFPQPGQDLDFNHQDQHHQSQGSWSQSHLSPLTGQQESYNNPRFYYNEAGNNFCPEWSWNTTWSSPDRAVQQHQPLLNQIPNMPCHDDQSGNSMHDPKRYGNYRRTFDYVQQCQSWSNQQM